MYTQINFRLLTKVQLSKDMTCLNWIWFTENKHQVESFQHNQSQHKYSIQTSKGTYAKLVNALNNNELSTFK